MYRQSEKNLLSSNISSTCPHNMVNFGPDRFTSLGHPCKFQRVSHLGSVTARHSSSGREPNFAALNRGCHLYSVGRPSRWALAHISSFFCLSIYLSFFPRLISAIADWMSTTLPHMVWLCANFRCRSETCCTGLVANTGCKKSSARYHRTTLSGYIFPHKARIDNRKKTC